MKRISQFILLMLYLTGLNIVQAADERPNVLLILCDDLGYSDLGCFKSGRGRRHLWAP